MTALLLTLISIASGVPAPTSAIPGEPTCLTTASRQSLAKRASPLDSVSFAVGSARVMVCYGRPSARGRTMIGGYNVPLGRIWRTGANEPTMIHVTGSAVMLAGLRLEPGTYSLYTVPAEEEWTIIVNRSIEQWGDEGSYADVKQQELGRGEARREKLEHHVEQFTIRPEPARGSASALLLEWEKTRVVIGLRTAG